MHDRHQDGVFTQGCFDHGRSDQAIGARLDVGDFEAFTLQLTSAVQNSLVLDLGGDQVLALGAVEVRDALDCQVVGLGGTAGPDNFPRVGIDQVSDLATGVLDRFFGFPAKDVGARRRVTEVPVDQQAVAHLLGNAWIDRGGRGVIEVDRQLH
ncbi:hypothetical protein D3C85_1145670 [compost metagenome]